MNGLGVALQLILAVSLIGFALILATSFYAVLKDLQNRIVTCYTCLQSHNGTSLADCMAWAISHDCEGNIKKEAEAI